MCYQSDITKEELYLKKTEEILDENIDILENKTASALKKLKEVSALYAQGESQLYMEIPALQQRYDTRQVELADNEKSKKRPYFGKTIFAEVDTCAGSGYSEDLTLYFGKKGIAELKEGDTAMFITDWRAPVAEIYYSSKLGKTSYQAPKGEIEVDLKLKTTLKIKNAELLSLYDAEFATNDDLLADYLSERKDVVLNDIIATIQEDQNRIIRRPLSKSLVVQGAAGSGKTTVAIHRIAYLLYNYKEDLKYNNLCLIAANKLFLKYITGMLPDLDVPDIKQRTIEEFFVAGIHKLLPSSSANYHVWEKEIELDGTGFTECYNNDSYTQRLADFLQEKMAVAFETKPVAFLDFCFLTAEEIERVAFLPQLSFAEKAAILDKRITDRVSTFKPRILGYICQNRTNEKVAAQVDHAFSLKGGAILEDSLRKKWVAFLDRYKNYFTRIVRKSHAKSYFLEFTGKPFHHPDITDMACYVQLLTAISGNDMLEDFRHIVIDEAQDFNLVIYSALRAMYPNATFTVVGDIMQNIGSSSPDAYDGLLNWDGLLNNVFGGEAEYQTLIKSYRNTIEISEFAQGAVKRLGGADIAIEPIIRHGKPVGVHEYVTPPERLEDLRELLKGFEADGYEQNAIVCKTKHEAERLFLSFKGQPGIFLLDPEEGMTQRGSYIVTLPNVKGLEFDCVVVWDFDSYRPGEEKQLYVALTRALHRLEVFSNQKGITV